LINVSSSPGRDLASTNEVGLGTAISWRTLMRTYAQLTTSLVVFCNRVGVDESISFWGGSEVILPSGDTLLSAPLFDEGLFVVDAPVGDLRRERLALPLLRDERPQPPVREPSPVGTRRGGRPPRPLLGEERAEREVGELSRIVAERAGLAWDSTADDGAEPGLDVES